MVDDFLVPPIERGRLPLVIRRTGTWEEHQKDKQAYEQQEREKKKQQAKPPRQGPPQPLKPSLDTEEHKIDCKI